MSAYDRTPLAPESSFHDERGGGPRRSTRKRPGRRWWFLLGMVAATVVAALGVLALLSAEVGVTVTEVQWSGSNSCGGLSGSTTAGFHGTEAASEPYSVPGLVNPSPSFACTIRSVTSLVPGFTVAGGDLPLTIPPGGSASLRLTIDLIGSSFDGPLSLMVS
jgi:hypothetical protein